jgi:hypothetical protein
MSRLRSTSGYALLAALVITCLAGVFAATCVAAVSARLEVIASDAAHDRAMTTSSQALDDVSLRLRRSPSAVEGSCQAVPANHDDPAWVAEWAPLLTAAAGEFPEVAVDLEASAGSAHTRLSAIAELRSESCAQGIVVAGDAELQAPVSVTGSGVYCGGSLRGREWLLFGDGAGGPAGVSSSADGVHPDRWPVAGVHAAGGIWAAGNEVHEPDQIAPSATDTDTHTGEAGVSQLTAPPSADLLCFVREHAEAPGDALSDGVLDLEKLPDRAGSGGQEAEGSGYAVFVPASDTGALSVVGERAASACPLTLMVEGDVQVGWPGQETSMSGALVVLGTLHVSGALRLQGHLYAHTLFIDARADLVTPPDWRRRPLAGLAAPTIVSLAGP